MLPEIFDTPSYFSRQEAAILPAFLYEQWEMQVKEIVKCQTHLKDLLESVSIKWRPHLLLTYENVKWVWNVVNTRCVYMDNSEHFDRRESCVLAPLLDLLNHSCEVEVSIWFKFLSGITSNI